MRYDAEQQTFELTKPDVIALLAFASTDWTREAISQVYFEPQKGRVTATDGTALAAAQNCGRSEHPGFGVPRATLEQAKALLRRKAHVLRVSRDGDAVLLVAVDTGTDEQLGQVRTLPTTVHFPPVDQVIPAGGHTNSCGLIGFDCALLARLSKVQKAADADGARFAIPEAELDPLRVDVDDVKAGTSWVCVVMPRRM